MTAAWVVRAGRHGEQEQANLDEGVVTVGWTEIGDLTPCTSRDEVRAMVDEAYPDSTLGQRANYTGQLWSFRALIRPGDLVIMPMKTKPGYLAMGRCTGKFVYDADEPDHSRRKKLPVEWWAEPIAKSGIKDDLLYSLNAISTVFSPSRNNAVSRLEQVLLTGTDPGSNAVPAAAPAPTPGDALPEAADVVDPQTAPTLDAIRDRIRTHLVENFAGHKLTRLVADILEALGFVCEVSPPGPDGGIDILAGRGPLGLDSPTLVVEVKSEPTAVGAPVVRGIYASMTRLKADQALLVAWGGVTKQASAEFSADRTRLRVWDAEEVLERLFATYDQLPAATRAAIPLTRAWVLDDESDG